MTNNLKCVTIILLGFIICSHSYAQDNKKEEIKSNPVVTAFIDSLCKAFYYTKYATPYDYASYNPNAAKLLHKRNFHDNAYLNVDNKLGPCYARFDSGLFFDQKINISKDENKDFYHARLNWLLTRIPGNYIKVEQVSQWIHISHAPDEVCVIFEYKKTYSEGSQEKLCFHPTCYDIY